MVIPVKSVFFNWKLFFSSRASELNKIKVRSFPLFIFVTQQIWENSFTISRLNWVIIIRDHHVRTHTSDNMVRKHSMEKINSFFLLCLLNMESNKNLVNYDHFRLLKEHKPLFCHLKY